MDRAQILVNISFSAGRNGIYTDSHGGLGTNMANLRANKIVGIGSTDAGVTFDYIISLNSQGYMYFPTGNTANRGRGRAIFSKDYWISVYKSRKIFEKHSYKWETTRFGHLTMQQTYD